MVSARGGVGRIYAVLPCAACLFSSLSYMYTGVDACAETNSDVHARTALLDLFRLAHAGVRILAATAPRYLNPKRLRPTAAV